MGPDAEESLRDAAALIRAYGAVAIVGAGISVEAGYPMLAQFTPFLRNSLLQDSTCREELGADLDSFVRGVQTALDEEQLRTVYAAISRHPAARRALQQAFALRDREQTENGGTQYMVELARLLHSRSIVAVLSLNWDTQLEAAYEREYGRRLAADGLWLTKPHGDARRPEEPWVLPFQPSNLSPQVLGRVRDLAKDRVRVLLMVGYSGQDEEILSNIVEPLAERWRVIRVGPGLAAPDVDMTASEAIPRLRSALGADQGGDWEYVRFRPSEGLAHALSGRGMLPGDAPSCPAVPEVEMVVRELRTNHSAYLLGASGSGKSLIAYQAALQLSTDGWEVARLLPGGQRSLHDFPHPTLAIVDDAQARPDVAVRSLYQAAHGSCAVLVVSNEEILGIDATVKVPAKRSVSILAEWMRKNIDLVKPRVMALDGDVGDGYLQTSLEDRIDRAEEQADRPWAFNFILTGGWRRAREGMASLKEEDGADLVLFAVAAGQLVTADTGLTKEELSKILSNAGMRDPDRNAGLRKLRSRKLVLDDPQLKCPHLGYAAVVVRYVCDHPSDPRWGQVEKIIEGTFDAVERTMLGSNWLLHELRFSDGFRWPDRRTAMSESARRWFGKSIWEATASEDIRSGLFALDNLPGWLPDFDRQIEANLPTMASFVERADEISAHGVAHFVNWFSQDRSHLMERLFELVSPAKMALVFEQASPKNAYAFANLAGRLSNCAPKPWVEVWRRSLPWKHFEVLIETVNPSELYAVAELVHTLLYTKDRRWAKLFWRLAPRLAEQINEDPIKAARNIEFGFWHLLVIPSLRRFWNLVDPAALGNAYSVGKPRDWHSLQVPLVCLWHGRRSRFKQISKNVDYDRLLASSDRFSDREHAELISVLFYLATYSDKRPVLAWLEAKGHLFESASRELATLLPGRASELILAGKAINLPMDGNHWGAVVTVESLRRLSEVSPEAARLGLAQNTEELGKALTLSPSANDTQGVADLITLTIRVAPETIIEAIGSLDKTSLIDNWRRRLEGDDARLKSAVTSLVSLTSARFSEFGALLPLPGNSPDRC